MGGNTPSLIALSQDDRQKISAQWHISANALEYDEPELKAKLLRASQDILDLSVLPELYGSNFNDMKEKHPTLTVEEYLLEFFFHRMEEEQQILKNLSLDKIVDRAIQEINLERDLRFKESVNQYHAWLLEKFPLSLITASPEDRSEMLCHLTKLYKTGKMDAEVCEALLLFSLEYLVAMQENGVATFHDKARLAEIIDASMMHGIGDSDFLKRTREIREGEILTTILKRGGGASVFGHASNILKEQKKKQDLIKNRDDKSPNP